MELAIQNDRLQYKPWGTTRHGIAAHDCIKPRRASSHWMPLNFSAVAGLISKTSLSGVIEWVSSEPTITGGKWVKYFDARASSKPLAITCSFPATALEQQFNELASCWYRETGMSSMIHVKAMHPSYQRIIGMGKDALPFIFRELNKKRGHWLWALCAITGQDAARPTDNIRQAVESWLQWGRDNGHI